MRILAVDDDAVILEILEMFLDSIDYSNVTIASSAKEALERIEEADRPFECILLDINMPGTSGIELLPRIRKIDAYAHTPIIMLTALNDRAHIAAAFKAGAWDYIVKPFEMFELEARMHSAELRNAEMNRLKRVPKAVGEGIEIPLKALTDPIEPGPGKTKAGLVIEDAFENCVRRASDHVQADLGLLMLQIAGFDGVAKAHPVPELEAFWVELARQLTALFVSMEGIVSYQGDGIFVALFFRYDEKQIEKLLQGAGEAVKKARRMTLEGSDAEISLIFSQVRSCDLPEGVEPLFILHEARTRLEGQSNMTH